MIFRRESLVFHGIITHANSTPFSFSISSLLNKLSTWNLHQTGNKKSDFLIKMFARLYGFNYIPVHYPLYTIFMNTTSARLSSQFQHDHQVEPELWFKTISQNESVAQSLTWFWKSYLSGWFSPSKGPSETWEPPLYISLHHASAIVIAVLFSLSTSFFLSQHEFQGPAWCPAAYVGPKEKLEMCKFLFAQNYLVSAGSN